ncbi:MAG: hypothetical protein JSC188_000013 [Candidatus Tokpelaia sp. JSC188]|nr:MAG: hypothetical protein JSC188_000013 [Candidatus Tokpelaia sp. JSC188]
MEGLFIRDIKLAFASGNNLITGLMFFFRLSLPRHLVSDRQIKYFLILALVLYGLPAYSLSCLVLSAFFKKIKKKVLSMS